MQPDDAGSCGRPPGTGHRTRELQRACSARARKAKECASMARDDCVAFGGRAVGRAYSRDRTLSRTGEGLLTVSEKH